MEDGDTEIYHASSLIQALYLPVAKWVVSGVYHRRYIINDYMYQQKQKNAASFHPIVSENLIAP